MSEPAVRGAPTVEEVAAVLAAVAAASAGTRPPEADAFGRWRATRLAALRRTSRQADAEG